VTDASGLRFKDGSMSHAYEEYLVPRLFAPWARNLIEHAKVGPNHHLLDVACGTGAVARLASQVVGLRGRIAACDPSRQMLEAARDHHRLPNAAGIEYFEVRAEDLPFEPESFHVVTCQQGLQFFSDRRAALERMRAVLRKGGRVAVSIWGPLETAQYWHVLSMAFKRAIPPLAELVRQATAYSDADELRAELEAAGFHKVDVRTERKPLVFEEGVSQALASVRGTLFGPKVFELASVRAAFEAAAKPIFHHCLTERGVTLDMTVHTATALKP
jgi:ubiquinone/menaquinone biosynthesis C-methylase UbiE